MSTYLFTMGIFVVLGILINTSDRLQYFIADQLSVGYVISTYYLSFSIWVMFLLTPLFILIAVIYFTSRLSNQNEIIALRNGGMSFGQLFRPYLITAATVAVTMLIINHTLLPIALSKKVAFENKHFKKNKAQKVLDNLHLYTGANQLISARNYRIRDSTARDVIIEKIEDNELKTYIKATSAKWQGATGKWKLSNYEIRKIDDMQEELIVKRGEKLDTMINLLPTDFINTEDEEATLTSAELLSRIHRDQSRGLNTSKKFEIEFHRRTADPFTVIILTLIGFAISSRKVRGGMGIHLVVGIAIGAIFIFLSRFTQTFAASDSIPVILGVWLPNIVFGAISIWLIKSAQK